MSFPSSCWKVLQIPETAVEITTVEVSIATNRMERIRVGLFMLEYLDNNKSQNYAKLKFNTKIILAIALIHLLSSDHKDRWHGPLPFFIRRFDRFLTVY